MTIYFKAGGMLKQYIKPDVDEYTRKIEIAESLPLEQIIAGIGLKNSHVSMALLHGKIIPMNYQPSDGDVITLRPPVQGG